MVEMKTLEELRCYFRTEFPLISALPIIGGWVFKHFALGYYEQKAINAKILLNKQPVERDRS